jgi:hypothetical protein
VLLIWTGLLAFPPPGQYVAGDSLLHYVNLPFHEAGHIAFGIFGKFVGSLGGTLGQLLVPLVCAMVLLFKNKDPFAASVGFWWLGENFLDIAPYINDARAGVLPLLGGNTGQTAPYGFHDWQYLLNETSLLEYDHTIAFASHFVGALIMFTSLAWALLLLIPNWRVSRYRLQI